MKLVMYEMDDLVALGMVYRDRVVDLDDLAMAAGKDEDEASCFCCTNCFLEAGARAVALARELVTDAVEAGMDKSWPKLASVKLRAPIPEPRKILALAGNYREHIREGGGQVQAKDTMVPQVFIKPITALIGPGDDIRLPGPICTSVDYEGELGVVIGKTCHYVTSAQALDYVAGYVIVNDVSGRKLNITAQREANARSGFFDWLNGKWFDTFAPMGPYLVLKDEIPDPQALQLTTKVNGQVRQQASTGDMIFTVPEVVAWVSQFVTLEPGDVIATGTPSGVGATTGTFLQAGDVVEVEISGLGVLRNKVIPPQG
jgi:2-keto-4-pentenoate hydratase/2-oxohepta-3-ene-1,7-dioic acid hydratase in catechol pathway